MCVLYFKFKFLTKDYVVFYTVLNVQVCCQYDGPSESRPIKVKDMLRKNVNNTKSLFIEIKVEILLNIRLID